MVAAGLDRVHSDGVASVFLLAARIVLHLGFGVAGERPDFDAVFVDGSMSIRKIRHQRNPKSPAAHSTARSHLILSSTVYADSTT